MLTISSLIANFKALNTDVLIQESLTETMPAFEKVQKEQLKAGKNNKGETRNMQLQRQHKTHCRDWEHLIYF
jgi:hypothetical protein